MEQPNTSGQIMQIGMGFWASKVLLSAVRFKLFTFLGDGRKRTGEIKDHLKLQTTTRHVCDWLDTLVSLGFLQRDGLMESCLVFQHANNGHRFSTVPSPPTWVEFWRWQTTGSTGSGETSRKDC